MHRQIVHMQQEQHVGNCLLITHASSEIIGHDYMFHLQTSQYSFFFGINYLPACSLVCNHNTQRVRHCCRPGKCRCQYQLLCFMMLTRVRRARCLQFLRTPSTTLSKHHLCSPSLVRSETKSTTLSLKAQLYP